jgi:ketosteroid isomerase-like protein
VDNIDVVRAGFDAFSRGERHRAHELCAPNIEWYPALGALLSQEVYRGPDEVCEVCFDEIPAVLNDFRSEVLEISALDDETVLAVAKFGGTAASTGLEIMQIFGQIYSVRDGRITAMRSYPSREAALAAFAERESA